MFSVRPKVQLARQALHGFGMARCTVKHVLIRFVDSLVSDDVGQGCLFAISSSMYSILYLIPIPMHLPYSVNVGTGVSEQRILLTGRHAVADIYCESCKTPVGWKYVSNCVDMHVYIQENAVFMCTHLDQ